MANAQSRQDVDPNAQGADGGLLFEAWVLRLAKERFGFEHVQSGGSGDGRTVTIGDPTEDHFTFRWVGSQLEVTEMVGVTAEDFDGIFTDASARVVARDHDEPVVYCLEMQLPQIVDLVLKPLHFMRTLNDQRRIVGARRLAASVLLDFEEEQPEAPQEQGPLLAPPAKVRVAIFSPGPGPSDLTRTHAQSIADTVAAICAFATGRQVSYHAPEFPADDSDAVNALDRRFDPAILGLARDSVSLDLFDDLQALGGADAAIRVRDALRTYHQALQATNSDVAVMLFVSSIEALLSPRPGWRTEKATKRFVKSLVDLCPDTVDELCAHGNVEETFAYTRRGGTNRQRRELLEQIYETRSVPTHNGLGLAPSGFEIVGSPAGMRVLLLSILARGAILGYIQSPRSSLVGHPTIDPPAGEQAEPASGRFPALTTTPTDFG